jgi:serine phosphatase RsbU (regulator of sigma subunit)
MRMRSLKGRLAIGVLAIYAAAGILILGAFLVSARSIADAFGRRFAEEHALLDRSRILMPLEREVALARKLADSELLKRWCREEGNPELRAQALAELESYRRFFSDKSWFFAVDASRHYYFNNAQDAFRGRELRYTLDPADPTMAWYPEAIRTIDTYSLHVDSSEQLGLLKVWINVIVKDGNRKLGLAGTGLDLSGFARDLVQGREKGVMTILLDRKGFLQAHPNPRYMEYNARMKDESRRMTLFQLLDSAAEREELRTRLERLARGGAPVETFELTVEGRRYLAAAAYMGDIDWVNLVLVDRSQVVGLRAFMPILAVLVLGLLATIALVSAMLNRMVVRPLEGLTTSSRRIAGGDYAIDLAVDREDEIGSLTASFNHMTATVRDHLNHLEEKVKERTEALAEANAQLSESSRKVTDSIRYAQLIQESLLPDAALLSRHMPDHLALFRPRDIVGGDFFGLHPDRDGFLLAVADCSGHGVPGAFMSMCAGAVLEQVLGQLGPDDPAALLAAVNRAMKAILHQQDRHRELEPLDNGLDMALLRVVPRAGRFVFAGARIPLWLRLPGGELQELRGDPYGLGYRRSSADQAFTNHEGACPPGTCCHLFTDGILDQSGGPKGFGLGQRRLRAFLDEAAELPMAEQGRALARLLDEWQGRNPQRDDITLLGFRTGAESGKE